MTASVLRPSATERSASWRRRPLSRLPVTVTLLLPFVAMFAIFYVVPILWALRTSLFANKLVGGASFQGLDAYRRALHDGDFLAGFRNVGILSAVQVPLSLGFALVLALVLDGRALRARGAFRLLIFLPYAVPSVIGGLMWGFMYDPRLGPLGQMTGALGLGRADLLSSQWMLVSLGNILTWSGTGIAMIILYTALKAIPLDLEQAAAVDGASRWDIVRTIKVPLLLPSIGLVLLISVIATLQLFNEPAILWTLAPQVIGSAYTPNLYAYNVAFQGAQLDYAAALAFVLAALVLLVSYGGIGIARLRSRS
ncbi:MAG: carbohydrate ABC transporter permease [Conexibacter sp.]